MLDTVAIEPPSASVPPKDPLPAPHRKARTSGIGMSRCTHTASTQHRHSTGTAQAQHRHSTYTAQGGYAISPRRDERHRDVTLHPVHSRPWRDQRQNPGHQVDQHLERDESCADRGVSYSHQARHKMDIGLQPPVSTFRARATFVVLLFFCFFGCEVR